MLESESNFLCSTEIQKERQYINIDDSSSKNGHKRDSNKPWDPLVITISEQRESHIGEYKVFRKEVQYLKNLLGPSPRLKTEVDVRVVRLSDAAEQYRNNT